MLSEMSSHNEHIWRNSHLCELLNVFAVHLIEKMTLNTSNGTPTKRQVSKRQVSKRLVSKRPVSKRQVYKTSGLQNVRFTKRQVSKRPVFKF